MTTLERTLTITSAGLIVIMLEVPRGRGRRGLRARVTTPCAPRWTRWYLAATWTCPARTRTRSLPHSSQATQGCARSALATRGGWAGFACQAPRSTPMLVAHARRTRPARGRLRLGRHRQRLQVGAVLRSLQTTQGNASRLSLSSVLRSAMAGSVCPAPPTRGQAPGEPHLGGPRWGGRRAHGRMPSRHVRGPVGVEHGVWWMVSSG